MSKVTSADIVHVLREKHYPKGEWAMLEQVAPSTGWNKKQRWLDVVSMSLWPSRGLELHGVEVKVSRSDWRRELNDPSKADAVARFCHRFFVAAPDGVIPKDEVPPAWGLLEVKDGVVRIAKKAEQREPEPVTAEFVAAVLRRASDAEAVMSKRVFGEALTAKAEAIAKENGEEIAKAAHADLVTRIADLERRLLHAERDNRILKGVDTTALTPWMLERAIAEAVANDALKDDADARRKMAHALKALDDAAARMRALVEQ